MDKNIPGTFSSDAEVNDFCNDLITSVRQMKEKKSLPNNSRNSDY